MTTQQETNTYLGHNWIKSNKKLHGIGAAHIVHESLVGWLRSKGFSSET